MKVVLFILVLGVGGVAWLLFGPGGDPSTPTATGGGTPTATAAPAPDVSGIAARLPAVPEPTGTDGTLALDPECLRLFEACSLDNPAAVRQLAQRDPGNALCYYMMAGCEMKQGRTAQAVALLEQGNRAPRYYWYASRAEDWYGMATMNLPHLQMIRQVGSDAKRAPELGVRGLLAYRQAGLRICRCTTPYPGFMGMLVGGVIVTTADKHLPAALAKEGRQAQIPQFQAEASRFAALLKQTKDEHNATLKPSADRIERLKKLLGEDVYAWLEAETKAGRVPEGMGDSMKMKPKEQLSPEYWAIQNALVTDLMAPGVAYAAQAAKRF